MKHATFLSALLLSASAAFAAATANTANVIGVLRVDSSAVRTIVSVPWVAAGVSDGSIKVTDIVKTANLTPADGDYTGDTLSYYNGESFQTWYLKSGGSGEAPYWDAAATVSQNGSSDSGTSSDEQTLPRGGALIVVRKSTTDPFYLQGQVPSSTSVSQDLPYTGTVAKPVYSLIAPPLAQTADIALTAATWTNIGANDQLVIPGTDGQNTVCEWKDSAWKVGTWAKGTSGLMELSWTAAPAVKAGTGFWYVNRTTSSTAPHVQW